MTNKELINRAVFEEGTTNKELKEEIKTHENLIRKKAEQKYINCQMDRVIETIKEELIEKIKEKRKDIRGLDEYDKYNRTEIYKKRKSYNKALRDSINIIKEE